MSFLCRHPPIHPLAKHEPWNIPLGLQTVKEIAMWNYLTSTELIRKHLRGEESQGWVQCGHTRFTLYSSQQRFSINIWTDWLTGVTLSVLGTWSAGSSSCFSQEASFVDMIPHLILWFFGVKSALAFSASITTCLPFCIWHLLVFIRTGQWTITIENQFISCFLLPEKSTLAMRLTLTFPSWLSTSPHHTTPTPKPFVPTGMCDNYYKSCLRVTLCY